MRAFTVRLYCPSSSAADFIKPIIPHFDTEYDAPNLVPCCPWVTSRLFGTLGPANPQLLHLVDQSSALQAKLGGCALRAADHPTDFR